MEYIEIRIGENTFNSRNKKITIASFHCGKRNNGQPIIFLKYGICSCKKKLFSMEQLLHALEHEYIELICRERIKFTKKVTNGFDKLSLKWHSLRFQHSCNFVRGWVYG